MLGPMHSVKSTRGANTMQKTTIGLAGLVAGLKVDGEWLFARRRIYNEGNEAWAAPPGNPSW
jgi:hypothetical protein